MQWVQTVFILAMVAAAAAASASAASASAVDPEDYRSHRDLKMGKMSMKSKMMGMDKKKKMMGMKNKKMMGMDKKKMMGMDKKKMKSGKMMGLRGMNGMKGMKRKMEMMKMNMGVPDMMMTMGSGGGPTDPVIFNLGSRRFEGITEGPGTTVFVPTLAFGGVLSLDVRTGEVKTVVPDRNFIERTHLGIWYHRGALFVAGARQALVYVYDAKSGEQIVACGPDFEGIFLNDVTVHRGVAIITDSQTSNIMLMDASEALKGNCVVESINLPDNFQSSGGESHANGVVGYGNGFIIPDTTRGGLYFINMDTGEPTQIASGEDVPTGDGLTLDAKRNLLYVNENTFNRISVWQLSGRGANTQAGFVGRIFSDEYDFPATSAIVGDIIYSANPRFGTIPFPNELEPTPDMFDAGFTVVGLNRFRNVVA